MNLRSVDLNLLVALDALLTEQHVSRAASRIGLSQPAMSNALGRLRLIFHDDLFVRTASGMLPTPRAEQLIEPVRQTLRQIEQVFESDLSFEPASSVARISIRLSDLLGYLLLPPLLTDIGRTAPGISLDVVHLSPARTVDALDRDDIQLAVSMSLDHPSSIRSEPLLSDSMVCMMRRDHVLASRDLTLDEFLTQKHLKVSMSPTDTRFVDNVLTEMGLQRTIAVNVPHWLLVPRILEKTDLISVLPGRIASLLQGQTLCLKSLPFVSASFDWSAYWHRRRDTNRVVKWLRGRLKFVCNDIKIQLYQDLEL